MGGGGGLNINITKNFPDYASGYKNEFRFIRGIDNSFEYFLENINKAPSGVFQNHRTEKINFWLRRFDRSRNSNTPINEIDEYDVDFFSCSFKAAK